MTLQHEIDLYDLEKTAVRHVTYAEQEAFYMGEGGNTEESVIFPSSRICNKEYKTS